MKSNPVGIEPGVPLIDVVCVLVAEMPLEPPARIEKYRYVRSHPQHGSQYLVYVMLAQ